MKVWVVIVAAAFAAVWLTGCCFNVPPVTYLTGSEQTESPESDCEEEVFDAFRGTSEESRSFVFDERSIDEGEEMLSLGFSAKEDVISFVTTEPKQTVDAPLCHEEVGRLFYLIVALFEPPVPVEGRLEKITFYKKEEHLLVCAEVNVILSHVLKMAHIDFLPTNARFFVCVPLSVKKSDVSANYEKIVVRCESFVLPEGLLCYGCEAAFGVKDYRKFFGEAVCNVFRNAYFYG